MKNIIAFFTIITLILLVSCQKQAQIPEPIAVPEPIGMSMEMGNHSPILQEETPIVFGSNKGDYAPDFEITTVDGKKIRLSELRYDRPVVLYFWASWCPYCSIDFDNMKDIYPKYKDDVVFLAVDMDTDEKAERIKWYRDKKELKDIDFAEGYDKLIADYQVIYTTSKYAIGRNGTILYKSSGNFNEEQWTKLFRGLAGT